VFAKKKRAVAASCALAVLALTAAACGSSSGSSAGSASGSGSGSTGQTLTIGWAENPDSLDPAITTEQDVGPIDANIFDTLTWLTPAGKVTPDLATSWTVSPDGKTYTFHLRSGVKFTDGTPFNAQAVVANIGFITAKATQSTVALSLLGSCLTAKAVSDTVVTISCATPYAPLLSQLSEPYMGIQSAAAITKYGKNIGSHLVGTGAFSLQSYVSNQKIVLVRNPAYDWAPPALGVHGPAKLAKLVYNIVPDTQSRLESLESGQSQFIQQVAGIDFEKFKSQFTALSVPVTGLGLFSTVTTTKWPTNDLAVRQAILYSVNRQSVVELADSGAFAAANTPLLQGMLGYSSSLQSEYPYDPAKAAQILEADGWSKVGGIWTKDGKQLSLSIGAFSEVPEYPLLAQGIQASLQANGMKVAITEEGRSAYLNSASNGAFNITPTTYAGVDPSVLAVWFLPGGAFAWSKYNSPTLTNLLNEGQVTTGTAQRSAIYQQVQQLIMQQGLMIPGRAQADLVLTAKNLTGVAYEGGGWEVFAGASLGA
jgi:peptide/nickel transport system substrate-binding protein